MKKFLAVIAISAALSGPAFAGRCVANDSWVGPDKTKHFAAGAGIGSAGTLVFKDANKGFLLGAGVGLAKELVDSYGGGRHCTLQDFAVTALGSAAGAYGTAWLVLPTRDERGRAGVFVGFSKKL